MIDGSDINFNPKSEVSCSADISNLDFDNINDFLFGTNNKCEPDRKMLNELRNITSSTNVYKTVSIPDKTKILHQRKTLNFDLLVIRKIQRIVNFNDEYSPYLRHQVEQMFYNHLRNLDSSFSTEFASGTQRIETLVDVPKKMLLLFTEAYVKGLIKLLLGDHLVQNMTEQSYLRYRQAINQNLTIPVYYMNIYTILQDSMVSEFAVGEYIHKYYGPEYSALNSRNIRQDAMLQYYHQFIYDYFLLALRVKSAGFLPDDFPIKMPGIPFNETILPPTKDTIEINPIRKTRPTKIKGAEITLGINLAAGTTVRREIDKRFNFEVEDKLTKFKTDINKITINTSKIVNLENKLTGLLEKKSQTTNNIEIEGLDKEIVATQKLIEQQKKEVFDKIVEVEKELEKLIQKYNSVKSEQNYLETQIKEYKDELIGKLNNSRSITQQEKEKLEEQLELLDVNSSIQKQEEDAKLEIAISEIEILRKEISSAKRLVRTQSFLEKYYIFAVILLLVAVVVVVYLINKNK